MFNRKKRELAAQQLTFDRAQREKDFGAAIQETCAMEDPARKVIALEKIGQEIGAQIFNEANAISKKTRSSKKKTYAATALPAAAGGITLAALVTGPVGWVGVGLVYSGYFAASIFSSKRSKSVKRQLEANAADHVQNLSDLTGLVSEIMKVTVEDNVEKISKSPYRGSVLQLPGIKDIFAAEAAKQIAAEKKAEAEAKAELVVEEKKPAARPKRDPNYKDIGQTGL